MPWIIGFITFMALEAVAMVYSNVLRDHVNRQFDSLCKAEVAFFISRAIINVSSKCDTTLFRSVSCVQGRTVLHHSQIMAMWAVTRFYNLLRAGVTWKGPELIEL